MTKCCPTIIREGFLSKAEGDLEMFNHYLRFGVIDRSKERTDAYMVIYHPQLRISFKVIYSFTKLMITVPLDEFMNRPVATVDLSLLIAQDGGLEIRAPARSTPAIIILRSFTKMVDRVKD